MADIGPPDEQSPAGSSTAHSARSWRCSSTWPSMRASISVMMGAEGVPAFIAGVRDYMAEITLRWLERLAA